MGRKNANATKTRKARKFDIAKGTHFLYSTHEFGEDATVVRYMGDQGDNRLYVFHPEGYAFWAHVHHLNITPKRSAV